MKTTTAKKKKYNAADIISPENKEDRTKEEEVAVIVDVKSGAEYYMFPIDFFRIDKRAYTVMVPYEPDRVRSKESEVVILRSQITKNGDQLYISIRDKKELEMAFNEFFRRFEESSEK